MKLIKLIRKFMSEDTNDVVEETTEDVVEETTKKGVIIAVFPNDERVEYSKEVHGDDFKQIAEDTCERLGGKIE